MLHFGQGQAMLEGKCFKAYFLHYIPLYKKKRKKLIGLPSIFFLHKRERERKGNFLCSTCNTKILVIYSLLWAMMMRRESSASVIL